MSGVDLPGGSKREDLSLRYMKGILLAGGELSAAEDGKTGFQMTSPLLPKLENTLDAQADIHTSELFIKLLCQFEPDAVLNFLQSHQAYRVQVCKQSFADVLQSAYFSLTRITIGTHGIIYQWQPV